SRKSGYNLQWRMRCDCGNINWATAYEVPTSLRCQKCELRSRTKVKVGMTFGNRTVLRKRRYNGRFLAQTLCLCGSRLWQEASDLSGGVALRCRNCESFSRRLPVTIGSRHGR